MKTLKERLRLHFLENEADFDQEETDNVLEILDECDSDDLKDASKWSLTLLSRMVNCDEELDEELRLLQDAIADKEFEEDDPFSFLL